MSDYKSDYSPDAEYQDSGYYGIPALVPPGQDKVPGGVAREGSLNKKMPPGNLENGNLERLKEELDWLRARVERLEQKENHND